MIRSRTLCAAAMVLVALTAVWGCQKKPAADNEAAASSPAQATCAPADPDAWAGQTPMPLDPDPGPHAKDCVFYMASWQHFLFASQPNADNQPAFKTYDTVETLFGASASPLFPVGKAGELSATLRVAKLPNSAPGGLPVDGSGIRQAGAAQGILIDQAGHPIYYAIHLNDQFAKFIRSNKLTTAAALQAANAELTFPQGTVELKSAWQVVDGAHPPAGYLLMPAQVPTLHLVNGELNEDVAHPRQVTLALVALHVVFVLKGHPEFIWSTFEHVDDNGQPDLAPQASGNPPAGTAQPTAGVVYKFFPGSASVIANRPFKPTMFDEATQTFRDGSGPARNSLFRAFPNSKSTKTTEPDEDVDDLNKAMLIAFGNKDGKPSKDPRSHYRLVGAVWLEDPGKDFVLKTKDTDLPFDNGPKQDVEDPMNRVLGGEDRLSSLAMESFTQTNAHNCFACHDSSRVLSDVDGHEISTPKKLNISHVVSRFLSEKPK